MSNASGATPNRHDRQAGQQIEPMMLGTALAGCGRPGERLPSLRDPAAQDLVDAGEIVGCEPQP